MAEVGCLRNGNFQNLEVASVFMQGGNKLKVAGYQSITTTAAAETTAASTLTANGIHFLAVDAVADVSTNTETITLPAAGAGINVGDFFTFVVIRASTAAVGFTITTATNDKIVGVVDVVHVTNTTVVSLANRQNTDGDPRDENNIDYAGQCDATGVDSIVLRGGTGDNAGEAGSVLTLTYAGNPDGTNAMYIATGRLISSDPDGTNAGTFTN